MADAAGAAGDGDPITTPAGAGATDDKFTSLPERHDLLLEGIDLHALFANMDQNIEFGESGDLEELAQHFGKAIEHMHMPQQENNGQGDRSAGDGMEGLEQETSNNNGDGIQSSGSNGMIDAGQDNGDEFDELFDDPPLVKDGQTTPPSSSPPPPHVKPHIALPTLPMAIDSNGSPPQPTADLDLGIVMSNITTLKSAMISNHLLLTRFLHLQSAYHSLTTTLAKERRLHAQHQSTIAQMKDELASHSHDSPLLQFQIAQLKEEVRKERATRTQSEATILQYQENIQSLKSQLEKVRKEKSKLEVGEKRATEAIKATDSLRAKIVGLMSENKGLLTRVEALEAGGMVLEHKRMEEEIVRLKETVNRLESNNIRLKAGRSILVGGGGNTITDVQPSPQTSPTTARAIAATTQTQSSGAAISMAVPPPPPPPPPPVPPPCEPIFITNDEVVFVGATNALKEFRIVSPTKAHSSVTTSNQLVHQMHSAGRASPTPVSQIHSVGDTEITGDDNDDGSDVAVLGEGGKEVL